MDKNPIITTADQVYSTMVNVGKVYCQLLTVMDKQAEILAKLNGTSFENEQNNITELFQKKLNETSEQIKADVTGVPLSKGL